MKKLLGCVLLAAMLTGCAPYHEAVLVEVGTNEEAFLIELEGEGAQVTTGPVDAKADAEAAEATGKAKLTQKKDYLRTKWVNMKRIEIPHRFKSTGRMWFSGKWIPNARIVKVDRSPCNRTWVADASKGTAAKDEGIWLESSDSVSFSTGIVITARIENKEDAITFLANYPAETTGSPDPDATYEVKVSSLENIMDEEVKNKVQELLSTECSSVVMDELRSQKTAVMESVRTETIAFFEVRGITITTLGMTGGFTYGNSKIQDAIDKVFENQQDKEVAKAETAAAEERKNALRLQGEGQAAEAVEIAKGVAEAEIAIAEAKATAIQSIADAKAYEIKLLESNPEAYMALKQLEIEEQRLKTWDGQYPVYMMTGGQEMPAMFMNMPDLEKLKAATSAKTDGTTTSISAN